VWIGLLGVLIAITVLVAKVQPALRIGDHIDTWWLKLLVHLRAPWLTTAARAIKSAGSGWGLTVLGLGTVLALIALRRWRHLLVFMGSLFVLGQVGSTMLEVLSCPGHGRTGSRSSMAGAGSRCPLPPQGYSRPC
jgi:hypothetical protein